MQNMNTQRAIPLPKYVIISKWENRDYFFNQTVILLILKLNGTKTPLLIILETSNPKYLCNPANKQTNGHKNNTSEVKVIKMSREFSKY